MLSEVIIQGHNNESGILGGGGSRQGFPSGFVVKNSSAVQETRVQSLGQEDP